MGKLEDLLTERNKIIKKLQRKDLSERIRVTNEMMLKLINMQIKLQRKK